MAYEFEVIGWEDWAGDVHEGTPLESDLPEVAGTFSHFWDNETGDSHYHWVYLDDDAQSWDEWWDAIEGSMEDHGYSVA
jgi:hypothetical protein